jgi:hypothetical protein
MAAKPDSDANKKINEKENFNFINAAFLNTTTTRYNQLATRLYVNPPKNVQPQLIVFRTSPTLSPKT